MGMKNTKHLKCKNIKAWDLIPSENPLYTFFECEDRLRQLTLEEGYTWYVIGSGAHADLTDLATETVGKYVIVFLDEIPTSSAWSNGFCTVSNFRRHDSVILTTLVVDYYKQVVQTPHPNNLFDNNIAQIAITTAGGSYDYNGSLGFEMAAVEFSLSVPATGGDVLFQFVDHITSSMMIFDYMTNADTWNVYSIYTSDTRGIDNNIFVMKENPTPAPPAVFSKVHIHATTNYYVYTSLTGNLFTHYTLTNYPIDNSSIMPGAFSSTYSADGMNRIELPHYQSGIGTYDEKIYYHFNGEKIGYISPTGYGAIFSGYYNKLFPRPIVNTLDALTVLKAVDSGNYFLNRLLQIDSAYIDTINNPDFDFEFSVQMTQNISTTATAYRDLKATGYQLQFKDKWTVPDEFKYFDSDDLLLVDRTDILEKYLPEGETDMTLFTINNFELFYDGTKVDIREDENFFLALETGDEFSYNQFTPGYAVAYYNDNLYDTVFGNIPRDDSYDISLIGVFQIWKPSNDVSFRNSYRFDDSPLDASIQYTDLTRKYIVAG